MKNPVADFLAEKKAFNMSGLGAKAAPMLQRAGEGAATGLMMGGAAAAFAGLAGAAGKLYEAATKSRDFKSMMDANPALHEHLQQDPAGFNRLYTSLRTLAPDFAKEPVVAGSYMWNALNTQPEQRGLTMVGAQRDRRESRQGPLTEAALGGFMKGVGEKSDGGKKQQLLRQTKTTSSPGAEGGDPAVQRIEESHNYYG